MDRHIYKFYHEASEGAPLGNFHHVILLNRAQDISWEEIRSKIPTFPKGWFELTHLNQKDRIEFTCDYWLSKLSYHIDLEEHVKQFFASLDDIGIYLTQKKYGDPYCVEMVYSLVQNSGFYRGGLPATEEEIQNVTKAFAELLLPRDYLSFLQIHNGLWKTTDCTGLIGTASLWSEYIKFQKMLAQNSDVLTSKGKAVNPQKLIPFYESFGMPYFQCFWAEWYPEEEMGNVYYTADSNTISDVESSDSSLETMAFPTFSEWLIFYLERVE